MDRLAHQSGTAAKIIDDVEPEGPAGVAAAADKRRLQQVGRVVMQGLREMAVEAVGIGVEQRAGEVLRGRLLGRQGADAGQVEPSAEMVVGIEIEALPPGGGGVLLMAERLLREPIEMPSGGEMVGLRQRLIENLDGRLRVSALQRSLGPAIAAVEHGVAGGGEMRGRACIGHSDRSSPGV